MSTPTSTPTATQSAAADTGSSGDVGGQIVVFGLIVLVIAIAVWGLFILRR